MPDEAAPRRLKPRIVVQKVLVVTSTSDVAQRLEDSLRALGMPAVTVSCRTEAITAFQHGDPEVVLICLDPADPDSGAASALAHRIRQLRPLNGPMIGRVSREKMQRARARAPFDFIMTGSDEPHFIYRTVRRLIQRRNSALRRKGGAGRAAAGRRDTTARNVTTPSLTMVAKAQPYFQILYVSRSMIGAPRPSDERALHRIGIQARFENVRHGITGALVHENGFFMQAIEGFERKVVRLMANIENDQRHTDVEIVTARNVPARYFDAWSMICFDVRPAIGKLAGPAFDPRGIEGDVLINYLRALVRHAALSGAGGFVTDGRESPAGERAQVEMF